MGSLGPWVRKASSIRISLFWWRKDYKWV
jgi:hypothetical protein